MAAFHSNNRGFLGDKSSFPQGLPAGTAAHCCHADGDFRHRLQTESAMSQTQEIGQHVRQGVRRRHDGSIDVDFYRARAAALRAQAIRDAFRHAGARFRTPFKQWWMRLVLLPSGR
jgi:hypothetical protein